ncbi:hypothetical protein JY742_10020 [Clostridioides difficile]|nr:hypothetical protein [Clostridioides difficile]
MATPIREIFDIFLKQIDDDILALMIQNNKEILEELLLTYLEGATCNFDKCKKDLSIIKPSVENEMNGEIKSDLDLNEKYILADEMILFWLRTKILREDNLRVMLTDHDYNQKSPANMLDKLLKLQESTEKKLKKKKIRYTYKGFKGF